MPTIVSRIGTRSEPWSSVAATGLTCTVAPAVAVEPSSPIVAWNEKVPVTGWPSSEVTR